MLGGKRRKVYIVRSVIFQQMVMATTKTTIELWEHNESVKQ